MAASANQRRALANVSGLRLAIAGGGRDAEPARGFVRIAGDALAFEVELPERARRRHVTGFGGLTDQPGDLLSIGRVVRFLRKGQGIAELAVGRAGGGGALEPKMRLLLIAQRIRPAAQYVSQNRLSLG